MVGFAGDAVDNSGLTGFLDPMTRAQYAAVVQSGT